MATEHQYEALGRTWVNPDGTKRRIYFPENLLAELIGLKVTTYKTGNISSASLNGQKISNGKADQIRTTLRYGKAYFDCMDGTVKTENLGAYTETIVAGLAARVGE